MYFLFCAEFTVDPGFIERFDQSALTRADLANLDNAQASLTPWLEYINEWDWNRIKEGTLWYYSCLPIMPFAIIDKRIVDLAMSFWEDPDEKILTGYRRLEDVVRERIAVNEHGVKLFTAAFRGSPPRLAWKDCSPSEQEGRTSLFIGAYMAYRNPRAHRELKRDSTASLNEFLLLNQLFLWETDATEVRELVIQESR